MSEEPAFASKPICLRVSILRKISVPYDLASTSKISASVALEVCKASRRVTMSSIHQDKAQNMSVMTRSMDTRTVAKLLPTSIFSCKVMRIHVRASFVCTLSTTFGWGLSTLVEAVCCAFPNQFFTSQTLATLSLYDPHNLGRTTRAFNNLL